ncbi:MAG: hypothetical protein R2726_04240 [Acidimicrobiales bacterium]
MHTTTASTTASTTTEATIEATGAEAPRSLRRHRGLAAVGLGLALATTAPVLAGPLAGVARADTVDPADQVLTQDDHGSHLYGHIRTTDGAALRLAGAPALGEHTHAETGGALPQRIAANGSASYQYSSDWAHEADMTFVYAIGDGTWELWTHANVPVAGANTIQAEIRRYGANQADPSSPYNVKAEWGSTSSYNPEPTFTITNKPGQVVTDRVEQAALLNRFCQAGNGACRYVPKTYAADVTGDPIDVAPPFYNDTKTEKEYRYTHGVTTTWEHKIGIEAKAEVEVAKVVNLGIKASYEVTDSTEVKDEQEMSAKVEPGWGVVFRYVPTLAKVSGDFTIFAEGTRYDLKDVDFTFPTGKGAYHAVDLPPAHE